MAVGTRYALILDPAALMAVERVQNAYGLKTKADAYDLAIRVLTWLTDQQVNGYEVGRQKGQEFQPLLLPYQPNASVWREHSSNGKSNGFNREHSIA
jgi:hypothetical protein